MLRLLNDIIAAIRSDPYKSLLSVGVISIGMLLLVILVSVLDALEKEASQKIRSLGVNVFSVSSPVDARHSEPPLDTSKLAVLTHNLKGQQIAPVKTYTVQALGNEVPIELVATSSELASIRGWHIAQGRFLSPADLQRKERVAVINTSLQEQWGWGVGNIVPIGRTTFKVIGVIDIPRTVLPGESTSDVLSNTNKRIMYVPFTLDGYWDNEVEAKHNLLDSIFIKSASIDEFAPTLARTRNLLSTPEYPSEYLQWLTPERLVAEIAELKYTLTLTLGGVSILSLLMGSITLVTLMLANVRERRIEIGLRRALGATPRDIKLQFVLEALLITVIAALLGYGLAAALIALDVSLMTKDLVLDPQVIWLPLLTSMVIGSVAAYWPARLAANINPAIALRAT